MWDKRREKCARKNVKEERGKINRNKSKKEEKWEISSVF
jgi:hypothetical protein